MLLLSGKKLLKEYGERVIFKDLDIDIHTGDRIGLVGDNGVGKTTLASLLAGHTCPDGGSIQAYTQPLSIGYLQQSTSSNDLLEIFTPVEEINRSFESERVAMTGKLGVGTLQDRDASCAATLSGGEKTRLALAHIWAMQPQLLILDEPTNHLDAAGMAWLIQELRKYPSALLVISHDRYFLDQTVSCILELDHGKLYAYQGNYTAYRKEKEKRYNEQLHQYSVQKKKEKELQEQIEKLSEWSDKAHRESRRSASGNTMGVKEYNRVKAKKRDKQIKSNIRRLERMQNIGVEAPQAEQQIRFHLDPAENRGRRILEANDLKKCFGERELFHNSSFYVLRGEKVGIIGPNGCGKTTLLKMFQGLESCTQGDVWVSPSASSAYLSQDVYDMVQAATAMEMVSAYDRGQGCTLLANMGFDEAMMHRRMDCLSLGERMRVKLAWMILAKKDLLILDEPTNHLDLHSREMLEKTLCTFEGTLLVVSHDRYFLEKVTDTLLVYDSQVIQRIESGYTAYLMRKSMKKVQDDQIEKERMLLDNRLSHVLSELSLLKPDHPRYAMLDKEFQQLLEKKKTLA